MGDSQYVPGVKGIGSSADGMDGDEENHEINQVIFMSRRREIMVVSKCLT